MLAWKGHTNKVRCLAFGPDGRLLASVADETTTVHLWDPTTGAKVRELRGRWGKVWGLAFSPDGALVATVGRGYAVVWDRDAGKPRAVLGSSGHGVGFVPDGSALVAVGRNWVAVWSDPGRPNTASLGPYAVSRREPGRVFNSAREPVQGLDSLAVSPDGRRVAANGTRHAVVWDLATGVELRRFEHPKATTLTAVGFSPDGDRLAVGHGKLVDVWPLEGEGGPVVLRGHTLFVRAVHFTRDGREIMTASSDGTVRFWDAMTGAEARRFDWGIGRVYAAAFAPDGLTCAAGGQKGELVVWDADG